MRAIMNVKRCRERVLYNLGGAKCLRKAEVFATSGHGGEECFAKILICLVLWQVKLCYNYQ
jgi:hypothetical protein